jgi:hypothetical protein
VHSIDSTGAGDSPGSRALLVARVTDDDGVLVLASAIAMRRRFAAREFNDDFPVELVSAAGDEELCAWQTDEEGDATIVVHVGQRPPGDARFLGVLQLLTGDELLILPYSQYTMACSYRRGEPEDIEGLCTRFEVEPGRYACWGRPAPAQGSPEGAARPPVVIDVYLLAATAADQPLRDVPVLKP